MDTKRIAELRKKVGPPFPFWGDATVSNAEMAVLLDLAEKGLDHTTFPPSLHPGVTGPSQGYDVKATQEKIKQTAADPWGIVGQTEAERNHYRDIAQGQTTELRAIDRALGNVSAFDGCKTRAEKIVKAMEMAKRTDQLEGQNQMLESAHAQVARERNARDEELKRLDGAFAKDTNLEECHSRTSKVEKLIWLYQQAEGGRRQLIAEVEKALDAAGAPHYDLAEEGNSSGVVRGWGFGERIAWLHTEKGLADARLTALQKVWQEKLDALTERATSAERSRDEFQKRILPLYGEAPGTIPYALAIIRKAMLKDLDYAWSWHCNIAMAAYDAGARPQKACNEGAARFLALLFPGVDTSKHEGYPQAESEFEQWFRGTDIALNARGMNGNKMYESIAKRAWDASRQVEDKKKAPGLSKDFDALPPFPYGMGMNEVQKAEALRKAGWISTVGGKWHMRDVSNPDGETLDGAYQIHAKMMAQPPWDSATTYPPETIQQ